MASSHCGRNRTLTVDLAGSGPLACLKRPLGGLKSPLGGLKVMTVHGEHVTAEGVEEVVVGALRLSSLVAVEATSQFTVETAEGVDEVLLGALITLVKPC